MKLVVWRSCYVKWPVRKETSWSVFSPIEESVSCYRRSVQSWSPLYIKTGCDDTLSSWHDCYLTEVALHTIRLLPHMTTLDRTHERYRSMTGAESSRRQIQDKKTWKTTTAWCWACNPALSWVKPLRHRDDGAGGEGSAGEEDEGKADQFTFLNAATFAKSPEGSYHAKGVRGEEDRVPNSWAVKLRPQGRNRLPSASNSPVGYWVRWLDGLWLYIQCPNLVIGV